MRSLKKAQRHADCLFDPRRKTVLSLARSEDSARGAESAESAERREGQFFIPASCSNEIGSAAPAGNGVFIYTGSVDMDIIPLTLPFLSANSAALGLLQAGREIFFVDNGSIFGTLSLFSP